MSDCSWLSIGSPVLSWSCFSKEQAVWVGFADRRMLVEDSGTALSKGGRYHAESDKITQENPDNKAIEATFGAT